MESSRDQGALVMGLRPLMLGDYARTALNIRHSGPFAGFIDALGDEAPAARTFHILLRKN
jgi:hypothetical protein